MQDKKSFILYADYASFVSVMTDEQKGQLFQQILDYASTGQAIGTEADPMVLMAWNMIKNNMDRDMQKWEAAKLEKAEKGKLGGVIRALKAGQNISEDNIAFLKSCDCYNWQFLKDQGVAESTIVLLGIPMSP